MELKDKYNLLDKYSQKKSFENYNLLRAFLNDKDKNFRLDTLETLINHYSKLLKPNDLFPLIEDPNYLIRELVIKTLSYQFHCKNKKILKAALSLLHVKDWLVVSDIIEILSNYINILKHRDINFLLKHKHPIVRREAFSLYCKLNDTHSKEEVLSLLKIEKSTQAKLGIYEGLYLLGEKQYLKKIIEIMLTTKQYMSKRAYANRLFTLLNRENFRTILESYQLLLKQKDPWGGLTQDTKKKVSIIKKRYRKMLKNTSLGRKL